MQEECMAWNGSDCRMFAVPALFTGLASVQVSAAQPTVAADSKNDPAHTNEGGERQEKENLVAKVFVDKVEITRNGNTRLTCNGEEKQIIIAKNGLGKILQDSLHKEYEIQYNLMTDGKAWYAIKAKELK